MYFSQSGLVDSRIGNFIGGEYQDFGRCIVVRHTVTCKTLFRTLHPALYGSRKQGMKTGEVKN